jgi:hypothetical protein
MYAGEGRQPMEVGQARMGQTPSDAARRTRQRSLSLSLSLAEMWAASIGLWWCTQGPAAAVVPEINVLPGLY